MRSTPQSSPTRHTASVIDHLKLHVRDVERSRAFYAEALAPLGYRAMFEPAPGVGVIGADLHARWHTASTLLPSGSRTNAP